MLDRERMRERFLAVAHPEAAPALRDLDGLRDRLGALLERGREEWPALDLQETCFIEHIASVLPRDPSAAAAIDSLRAGDLYLACACARGVDGAIAAFDARHRGDIDRAVARGSTDMIGRGEFRQFVHAKLFLAEPGRSPKIAEYSGSGSLKGWVRITAKRTYLDLVRTMKRRREVPLQGHDAALVEGATGGDPEAAYLKQHYRNEFRESFARALSDLGVRERNVLRHSFIHRLGIDDIARLYDVHRSTAARWISRARAQVLEQTLVAMRERLSVGPEEVQSIMRLIESRLEVTVSRLLREPDDETAPST